MRVFVKFKPEDGLSKYAEKTLQVERFWLIDAAKETGVPRESIKQVNLIRTWKTGFTVDQDGSVGLANENLTSGMVNTNVPGVVAVFPSWKQGAAFLREDVYLQDSYYITMQNNGMKQNTQLFAELEVVLVGEQSEREQLQSAVEANEKNAVNNVNSIT